jgi:hypothetical protein
VISRPRCDVFSGVKCDADPTWKVREPGSTLARNWFYACGRHLHSVAKECAPHAGSTLDLVRVTEDE